MKRLLIIFVGLVAIVGLTCAAAYYSVYAILSRVPEDELWRITELRNFGSPIINGDYLLFEINNEKDCHCVYAADKLTGEIIWSTEDLAAPFIEKFKRVAPDSTRVPAIVKLYATGEEQGITYIILNYTLYALDTSNGDVLWGPIKLSGYHYVESLYVEYSNNVIFVLSDGGNLLALDAATGNELWSRSALSEETLFAYLRLHESNIYVVANNSRMVTISAFGLGDGDLLWAIEVDPEYRGRLFFSGNTLVIGTGGSGWSDVLSFAAFELDEGTNLWDTRFEEKGNDDIFPSITKDQLFLVIDKHNDGEERPSKLVVMDSKTGELLWEFNQSFTRGKITYFVWDEIVYVGTQNGTLIALNFEDGNEIWSVQTTAFPICFTEESDSLIVITESSSLLALDLESGAQKWSADIKIDYLNQDCFESSGRVEKEDGYIYIASNNGVLHAINSLTGEETWSWFGSRSPLIALIEGDRIYIYSGGSLSGKLFALKLSE